MFCQNFVEGAKQGLSQSLFAPLIVGFRSANIAKVIARKLGRCMGAGTVLELSALPNLQILQEE